MMFLTTYWPILRPMSSPTRVEKLEWNPAQIRACDASSVNAHILVQRWVTPGAVGLVKVTSGTSAAPNSASTTDDIVAAMMQCAHGHSGWSGVLSIGCQVASRSVFGLSSISPFLMAVIGRQKS